MANSPKSKPEVNSRDCHRMNVGNINASVSGPRRALSLKGHSSAELHIYFLVHLESIYCQIFFYSKIVPNCAVAK